MHPDARVLFDLLGGRRPGASHLDASRFACRCFGLLGSLPGDSHLDASRCAYPASSNPWGVAHLDASSNLDSNPLFLEQPPNDPDANFHLWPQAHPDTGLHLDKIFHFQTNGLSRLFQIQSLSRQNPFCTWNATRTSSRC